MNPKVTRRRFIKGVIFSATAATAGAGIYISNAASSRSAGAVERLVSLTVNGRTRRVDVRPQETLAHTLRYRLNLTGTKLACNRGECGACTVMLDNIANYSCSLLTHQIKGREITTVEGLRLEDGTLHCTPGQVVSAAALLIANPNPTREEARQGLSGNLCRCGAYDHYLNGVMRAAELIS